MYYIVLNKNNIIKHFADVHNNIDSEDKYISINWSLKLYLHSLGTFRFNQSSTLQLQYTIDDKDLFEKVEIEEVMDMDNIE